MTKDDALKKALEFIEQVNKDGWILADFEPQMYDTIAAIKEALAQQQEPVAWRYNGKLHEFDPSDWATGPVTPLYTAPPAKPWVNPSIKEYEDIMLANITPRTNDERDGIMGALSDMVVLLQEKNT